MNIKNILLILIMTVFFLPFVQAQKIYEWRNTNRN